MKLKQKLGLLVGLTVASFTSRAAENGAASEGVYPELNNVVQVTAHPFADGDVVAFIGDSITAGDKYRQIITDFYYTRYPMIKFTTYNRGVAGNTAEKALLRLDEDILLGSPSKATIMLGMNEGRYAHGRAADAAGLKERDAAAQGFRDNMTVLVDKLNAKKIGITLIGPSIYDQTAEESVGPIYYKGFNDALVKYKDFVQELAKKKGWDFVDFNSSMLAVNAWAQAKDPKATVVGKDRVHPGPLGYYVMSYVFLKSQGVQGLVASVEIDAHQAKVVQAVNCAVRGVEGNAEQVAFRYEPKSLPFPVGDKTLPEADELVPFTRELNQELLKITGLKPGRYTVVIDDVDVADYSATQLEAGVNLAVEAKNPQQVQAQAVSAVTDKLTKAAARYRALKLAEFYMKAAGVDTAQFSACKDYLEKYLDVGNKKRDASAAGYYKNYIDTKPKELSILADVGTLQQEVYAKNKPGNYKVVVRFKTASGS